jgi:hypothetical protein
VFGVREIAVRRRLGIALLAVLASFCLAASADAAITLRDGATFKKLATFKTVNCADSAKKGFTGTATNAGWKLSVQIKPFPKYKTYTLFYRDGSPAKFTVSKGAVTYSSTFSPESDPLHEKKGGVLSFPGGPGKIGISFGTAFQVDDENSYASLGGLATCS